MDRITKNLLSDFAKEHSLQSLSEEETFEHFTAYLVTTIHYNETFSPDLVTTGPGEIGIDGIAILVNGMLIEDPYEIDDLANNNSYVDATIVFVQTERSQKFDMAKAGHFGFAVQDFFSETPQLNQNQTIQLKRRIMDQILRHSSKFRRGNPQCFLYYVTTGNWNHDHNLSARKKSVENDLQSLGLFRNVSFEYVDASYLQKLYRDSQNAITKEIVFTYRTTVPDLPNVEQSYLGLLQVSEFLKLIENSNQEILATIFYDNVRHWQEWNQVNTEIKETLYDQNQQVYFPLLNNGITIVARSLIPTGNKMVLEDYQVVNGCQTSFVLHETRNYLRDDLLVPLRLIATRDAQVRNSIIKATNRQTQVTDDQFFALTEFPRKLENYFPTFEGNKKLYYERRSRQYSAVQGIEKVRVISMTMLIRAFASMFLEIPHRTTRNYKELLKSIGADIFNPDHNLDMYYVAGYAHYRLEYLFRSQHLKAELKPARYHLLMAFRRLASDKTKLPNNFNARQMKPFCENLMEILWDEEAYKEKFDRATEVIAKIAYGNYNRDHIRTETFTKKVLEHT
jgi:hypothetical protein